MKEVLKELEILTQSAHDDPTKIKLLEQTAERVGSLIAKIFSVREQEVAILLLSPRQNVLKFEHPKALRNSGTIPLSGRVTMKDAIALRSMSSKKGEVINAASSIKHLAIFEMVKVGSEPPQPIQKMISAPIILPTGKAIGVIQVSRKGESQARAGSDFTDTDLKTLDQMCAELAPYFAKIVPNSY